MTIIEQIRHEAEALSSKERRHALKILRRLRSRAKADASPKKRPRKTLGKARIALKSVKGMWRDRTDLPSDTVEASMELRKRVMRRGINV